ncbi:ATPase components of ABC transporters with duplicated ATPase domains [Actinobaculum suis]|uniref:ABC transporter-like protein n=1 Tax=Actinobaculum suis TaxID=1657 RepID=A0A1B9BB33_9ACTO|nr:ABC-F family ATP-binding cassette domain-containing protein [Actinobaculum suis]MDY5153036.1 ABC-F family ATP-binding cassette domain-containing protein [Actinobaculum suis]OCA93861.1 ABC transporter [Actinobaculum suis]OCA93996.1 ABC transporter [Actinobaculum suis]SDE60769.1 ATPase components of ABC transporters with duplicated ATPase domains [Actinobaculum suis]VDG76542.1 ABC transporter-like protein [Actinobaculum suis]
MISAQNLTIRIGSRELLKDASFRVAKGMRVGMVGRNGAGKTTTMRLLAGEGTTSDAVDYEGQITRSGSVAYLPQESRSGDPQQLARDRILEARGIDATIRAIRKAERQMSELTGNRQQKAMERYVRLDQEFTNAGGWAANAQASQIAASLGLDDRILAQELGTLSGGQRRRVELARVLFSGAETLLLDEPTNHLDHDSLIWLRNYLKTYSGGFIVISHSVDLLEETVTSVWHLDANRASLDVYNLGWNAYLKQLEVDERRRRRERANAEKKASALLAQAQKMQAKATKAVAAQNMARRAENLLAGLEEERQVDKVAALRFPEPAPCGKTPLRATGLTKFYGSLEVFTGVDLAIDRGSKVVVLGLNGAGKTTLLRLLYGVEEPDSGEVIAGHGLKLGYYAQEHEFIDTSKTVVDNLRYVAPEYDETGLRTVLGSFLFSGDDAEKPAGVLSGGEQTRLSLAMLVVSKANVLLLDEPTNNLDPASREQILDALRKYEGAVVLVTHDDGAVQALNPERVLLLPDGDEDLWSDDYLELVSLA